MKRLTKRMIVPEQCCDGVRRIVRTIVFIIVLTAVNAAAAQTPEPLLAPGNDNIANAEVLSGVSGSVPGTTTSATKEAGEPAHAFNRGGHSVWYKFVAPGNGVLHLDNTAGYNTLMAVYTGSSIATLKLIGANDDANGSSAGTSEVNIGTASGTSYYIAVDGKWSEGSGTPFGGIFLNYSFINVMPNDSFANAIDILPGINYAKAYTNVGASIEAGEPTVIGNQGGKSVWYRIVNNFSAPTSVTVRLDQSNASNPASLIRPLFAVFSGTSLPTLTQVMSFGGDRIAQLTFVIQPGTTYYIKTDGFDTGVGAQVGNFILSVTIAKSDREPDFDNDRMADLAVYRPTTGTFYSYDSSTETMRAQQWGLNGDKPSFGQIDFDGNQDYFVFRPDTSVWYETRSFSAGSIFAFPFGLATDIPLTWNKMPTDGIRYTYATVFRPATGTWWIHQNSLPPIMMQFGLNGDIPMTFDYDGDGTDEIAVFRPSTGVWYIAKPVTGQFVGAYVFGQNGDIPVPADYNGDGMAEIAIFRPATGTWWFRNSQTGAQSAKQWGAANDKPQPADYDGDGRADLAVFRNGTWWIQTATATKVVQFGLGTDIPITAPGYQ